MNKKERQMLKRVLSAYYESVENDTEDDTYQDLMDAVNKLAGN